MTDHVSAVGESAPVAPPCSTLGQPIGPSACQGNDNVLLAYFPSAFSTVGTSELCAFQDDIAPLGASA